MWWCFALLANINKDAIPSVYRYFTGRSKEVYLMDSVLRLFINIITHKYLNFMVQEKHVMIFYVWNLGGIYTDGTTARQKVGPISWQDCSSTMARTFTYVMALHRATEMYLFVVRKPNECLLSQVHWNSGSDALSSLKVLKGRLLVKNDREKRRFIPLKEFFTKFKKRWELTEPSTSWAKDLSSNELLHTTEQ